MPTYVYRCPKCKSKVELTHLLSFSTELPCVQCAICKIDMKIEIQPVNIEIHGKFTADTGYSNSGKDEE